MAKSPKGNSPNISSGVSSGAATATATRPMVTKTPQVTPSGKTPTYEQIAQRAQEIWKKKGCLPGQDEQNWLEAERQLKAESARK